MELLSPCVSCRRHVRVSSAACPFCRAPRLVLALSLALALPACDRSSTQQPDATAEAQRQLEQARQQAERARQQAEQAKENAERSAAVYGGPPRPRPAPSGSVRPCDPKDPLCGM